MVQALVRTTRLSDLRHPETRHISNPQFDRMAVQAVKEEEGVRLWELAPEKMKMTDPGIPWYLNLSLNRRMFLKASALSFTGASFTSHTESGRGVDRQKDGPGLTEKIGRMLLVGFRGLRVDKDHPIVRDIVHSSIGGVVLFDYDMPSSFPVRNIESPDQLKKLVSSLQSFAANNLIVTVDHEGGRITRLKEKFGFPRTLSAQALGRKNDPEFTFTQARDMAKQLARAGINLNLAPVVDLNINPSNPVIGRLERSFSRNPDDVVRHAGRFIEAHRQQGVLCCLKHFPGHGSSVEDSHLGMVDISSTWSAEELKPYRNLIKEGMVDAIMTAHVFNRHLDPDYPATLSKRIITGLLRQKFNYSGVIISDDMQMGAIAKIYGLETAIYRAIDAGVDILAFANNSIFDADIVVRTVDIIKRLIARNRIDSARIDESFLRISRLAGKLQTMRESP